MNKTLKLALFLAVVSAISGGLLGLVNSVTAPVIEAQKVVVTAENGFNAGTYEGSAKGFSGNIHVTVEVSDTAIVSISIDESENNSQMMNEGSRNDFANTIIEAQSTDVDTVSSVTYTTEGIKNAVIDALQKAVK